MEHVTYVRIQRALEPLATTGDKLESVAAQVGYRSRDVFTRAFLPCVGMPRSDDRVRSSWGRVRSVR